eukprot:COSAG05_NODE_9_length_39734_cov_180.598067_30_plen_107_part_00
MQVGLKPAAEVAEVAAADPSASNERSGPRHEEIAARGRRIQRRDVDLVDRFVVLGRALVVDLVDRFVVLGRALASIVEVYSSTRGGPCTHAAYRERERDLCSSDPS